jgi:hypothetical protein
MVIHHRPSAINHFCLGSFGDAAALDAVRAGLDPATHTIYHSVDHLQVWPEYPRRHRGYVLADAALFLCLATSQDMIPARFALATNFTTSRHD